MAPQPRLARRLDSLRYIQPQVPGDVLMCAADALGQILKKYFFAGSRTMPGVGRHRIFRREGRLQKLPGECNMAP